jgi:hypothetical protein
MTKTSWKSKVPAVQKWVSCQILRSGCLSFFWQLRALKNKARAASSASFQARALGAVKGVYKEPSASAEERRIPLRRTMPPSEAAPAPEGRIPESLSLLQDRVRDYGTAASDEQGPAGGSGPGGAHHQTGKADYQVRACLCICFVGGAATTFLPPTELFPILQIIFLPKRKTKTHTTTTPTKQATNGEGPSSDEDSNQDGDGGVGHKEGDGRMDAWKAEAQDAQRPGQPAKRKKVRAGNIFTFN